MRRMLGSRRRVLFGLEKATTVNLRRDLYLAQLTVGRVRLGVVFIGIRWPPYGPRPELPEPEWPEPDCMWPLPLVDSSHLDESLEPCCQLLSDEP